jgi:hypothetical protein
MCPSVVARQQVYQRRSLCEINHLPTTKPARKHSVEVAKKPELARIEAYGTFCGTPLPDINAILNN